MRITYRNKGVDKYWHERWHDLKVDNEMSAINDYPLKYAIKCIEKKNSKILEAGCGNGRILRYFHNRGYDIYGFDYIESAITKLKKVDSSLRVTQQNILKSSFSNEFFDYILSFGLYHNFKMKNLQTAFKETHRILKHNGKLCLSFRADNFQNYLNDYSVNLKTTHNKNFHKLNLKKRELLNLLFESKFEVNEFYYVQNMPFLYKFRFFRHNSHKKFDESIARKEGYKLNLFGNFLQKCLINLAGQIFCNVYVVICKKI